VKGRGPNDRWFPQRPKILEIVSFGASRLARERRGYIVRRACHWEERKRWPAAKSIELGG